MPPPPPPPPPPAPPPPADGRWNAAWAAALDDLELTLEETERVLRNEPPAGDETGGSTPWTPPQVPGPLPPEMLQRAQELLQRQQLMIAATTRAMTGSRQSQAFVNRVSDATAVRRSEHAVYLDVRA